MMRVGSGDNTYQWNEDWAKFGSQPVQEHEPSNYLGLPAAGLAIEQLW